MDTKAQAVEPVKGYLYLRPPFEDENGNDISGEYITLQSHREAMAKVTRRFEELKRHGVPYHVHNEAIAKKDAALQACVGIGERWVIVRESVLDVGLGDDVRTGGKPELGYALIPELGTFGSEEEASTAISSLGLPLGWVRMPLSRLVPDVDAYIQQAQEALK